MKFFRLHITRAAGPQSGSRGEALMGDQGAKPPENDEVLAISGPTFCISY